MDSSKPCNRGKILSTDGMNFLKASDSKDSSYFTNNKISHSFWNCGGTHVTACCMQCVLMKQISTCDTHDLTDQLHSLVHVMFRTGEYDCFLEKQHWSTDDKHYSGLVRDSDEVQLRKNFVFSYDHRVVKSLRLQGITGSLGYMFLTKLHSNVILQDMYLDFM